MRVGRRLLRLLTVIALFNSTWSYVSFLLHVSIHIFNPMVSKSLPDERPQQLRNPGSFLPLMFFHIFILYISHVYAYVCRFFRNM